MTRGKEKLKKLILICLIALMLAGCKKADMVEGAKDGTSMFVVVEQADVWKVVYHRETKVLYVVSDTAYNSGTFTLLVDADGKPLLYKEADDEQTSGKEKMERAEKAT